MRVSIFLMFVISTINATYAQRYNSIGFDFIGGYIVAAPKLQLEGDKYNPYTKNTSSTLGIYYEKHIEDYPFSIKGGVYFNYQFKCIRSIHIPIDLNGNILGKRNSSFVYLGYTAGASYNSIIDVFSSISYFVPQGTSAEVTIKKDSYLAPHIGFNSGINFKRFGLTGVILYHFFVPEFVNYKVMYNNLSITENNTNNNYGVTLRFGLNYKF